MEYLVKHQSDCQEIVHLRKLVENLDEELNMKIPDQYKPLSKLEDHDFLDFITSIYTDEAKKCKSLECICARIRQINQSCNCCHRLYT